MAGKKKAKRKNSRDTQPDQLVSGGVAWRATQVGKKAAKSNDGKVILLGFRVENGAVNLINQEGDNVPLFPAERLDMYDMTGSLRGAITALMQDDNG